MKTQTVYMGTRVLPKIKETVEREIPARWPSTSAFVQEAIVEKMRKEKIQVPSENREGMGEDEMEEEAPHLN